MKNKYKLKSNEINTWKNPFFKATIILAIICLAFISYGAYNKYKSNGEQVNIDNVKISLEDLGNFYNQFGGNVSIQLCDLKNEICTKRFSLVKNPNG